MMAEWSGTRGSWRCSVSLVVLANSILVVLDVRGIANIPGQQARETHIKYGQVPD